MTSLAPVWINAIGTAVPGHDIHRAFIDWAAPRIADPRARRLFQRMADRSGIAHRWSVLPPTPTGGSPVAAGGFYADPMLPPTSARMALYGRAAPDLAGAAVARLAEQVSLAGITHLIVASCTGFTAPGIDQILAERIGLSADVERLLIGFMGCYAAATALRSARHVVRSEPAARVLVVSVELSTLHLQPHDAIEPLLAMLLFGDGAAAALVTAEPRGLAVGAAFSVTLPESQDLIGWEIGDRGFAMHLSGEVPGRIQAALGDPAVRAAITGGTDIGAIDGWAVHAGGRSILDAVEHGLALDHRALDASRRVLAANGNMSSATLMFVLADMLHRDPPRRGVAIAFGPGLAAEGFGFGNDG